LAVKTLADVIDFNEKNRDKELSFFGQDLLTESEKKGTLTDPIYLAALDKDRRISRAAGIDLALARNQLTALIALTASAAWTTDLINGDHVHGGSSTPAAVAGYPNVTVPAGFVAGLPIGVSFFGTAWSEPALIKLAYAFEQNTRHRRTPRLAATADIVITTK
jgi:amidase